MSVRIPGNLFNNREDIKEKKKLVVQNNDVVIWFRSDDNRWKFENR